MLKKLFKKKARSDSGDALVSTIIVIPLLIVLIFTIIDISVYFNNRSVINSIARDSARTVAIVGGTESPLKQRYAIEDIEQNTLEILEGNSNMLTSMQPIREGEDVEDFFNVRCGPTTTSTVGEETFCEIDWSYRNMGLSAFIFLPANDEGYKPLQFSTVRGTAESEVGFAG